MRAVIQRVTRSKVTVDGEIVGEIGKGLLVLLAVASYDTEEDIEYISQKVVNLRIFPDENGLFNRSLLDVKGEILVVSQFTLYGDCRKGRRPSFTDAAPPKQAEEIYEKFIKRISKEGLKVATGKFQAMMDVELVNDGPVTILLDSKKLF